MSPLQHQAKSQSPSPKNQGSPLKNTFNQFSTELAHVDSQRSKNKADQKSRLSPTLLSNFLLTIVLLKHCCLKFNDPDSFETTEYAASQRQVEDFEKQFMSQSFSRVQSVEQSEASGVRTAETPINSPQSMMGMSYLVMQHKFEILDNAISLKQAL